jgi:2-keto-4-pentenoate hydratase/2-oxohepta-3-ene-1,7-dioic acid hydratase in catechol pathway
MKLCMFSPKERELERGWPGRIEGDRVIQLAAQTLQAFFTGGGSAREHAEFRLADVMFRPPVLHPGAVRIFDTDDDFVFGNPSCMYGHDDDVPLPEDADRVDAQLRIAAVIGAGIIGGFTLMNDWLAPDLAGTKAHDFATSLGPVVVTPDEFDGGQTDWNALLDKAELSTRFFPGDVIAAPAVSRSGPFTAGDTVTLELEPIGVLRNRLTPATRVGIAG